MAKAVKNKSGTWSCRGYDRTTGKQKSFTADTKREAERMAAEYSLRVSRKTAAHITFLEAAEDYLAGRSAVLSPSTIAGYRRMVYSDMEDLHKVKVDDIDSRFLQKYVNTLAQTYRQKSEEPRTLSPKTIRNRYNLITAIVRAVVPTAAFSVELPKKVRRDIVMPSEEEIRRLLEAVEDTDMEVPVLLALFGPMRRGEICALTADCIQGNTIHVKYAVAEDGRGNLIRKAPKTYSGDRFIVMPDFVIAKLPKEGPVTSLSPNAISSRMPHIMKHIGLSYTFHQLRHWSVSYLHRMGLSDQEILDRAGWHSTGIFKEVYRHGVKGMDRAAAVFEHLSY